MTERNLAAIRAYRQGRNAFLDGLTRSACPYEEEHDLRRWWEDGYDDAFAEYAEGFGA